MASYFCQSIAAVFGVGSNHSPAATAIARAMTLVVIFREADVVGVTQLTHIQIENANMTVKYKMFSFWSCSSTDSNQTATIKRTKPIDCLNSSVHLPDLGRYFSEPGIEVRIAYGAAIPRPMSIIARVDSASCWVCAHAKTAVKIAKLHGVLKMAAKNPMPMELGIPLAGPLFCDIADGTMNVKVPNINRAKTTIRIVMATRKIGFLKWSPHWNTVP